MEKILISACLMLLPTRYDQKVKRYNQIESLREKYLLIPFCPEQVGGLPTPRSGAGIELGKTAKQVLSKEAKIYDLEGKDVTKEYILGAEMMLKLCESLDIKKVILKQRSPSCGYGEVFNVHSKLLEKTNGITAELLERNNIKIYTEESLGDLL